MNYIVNFKSPTIIHGNIIAITIMFEDGLNGAYYPCIRNIDDVISFINETEPQITDYDIVETLLSLEEYLESVKTREE